MDITTRLRSGQGDVVLFAITPPRQSTPAERLPEIARATVERLQHLDLDGLVLYDIDDESSRNPAERPFPFSPTVDPSDYRSEHLPAWPTPVIVYRAVGKYPRDGLSDWLREQDPARTLTVMVGAASSGTTAPVTLAEAQAMRADVNPDLLLGGVAIPERHSRRDNEHLRLIAKQEAGCRFFVTQVVYDLNAAKTEDVKAFFDLYYAPNNATLVLAGDFETAAAKKLISDYFGGIPRGQDPPAVTCDQPYGSGQIRRRWPDAKANLPGVLLAYRIPEYKHADFPALSLLATILGQGESSRINKAVVRDLKLAQFSVSLLNPASPRRGPGVFLTLAVVNQGVVADSLEAALAAQVARIATEGVTAAELDKARNAYRTSLITQQQQALARIGSGAEGAAVPEDGVERGVTDARHLRLGREGHDDLPVEMRGVDLPVLADAGIGVVIGELPGPVEIGPVRARDARAGVQNGIVGRHHILVETSPGVFA